MSPQAPSRGRRGPRRRSVRLVVDVVDGRGRRLPAQGLDRWLSKVAAGRATGIVTIALVSDRTVRRLNRQYRGVDRATDVLSFPAFDAGPDSSAARSRAENDLLVSPPVHRFLGDIVIARGVARRQAMAAQHDTGTELRLLSLHGLLHLLGYDHEADGGTMGRLERRLRRAGRLREGLIERVESLGVARAMVTP